LRGSINRLRLATEVNGPQASEDFRQLVINGNMKAGHCLAERLNGLEARVAGKRVVYSLRAFGNKRAVMK
jgi:hypothetical protein